MDRTTARKNAETIVSKMTLEEKYHSSAMIPPQSIV